LHSGPTPRNDFAVFTFILMLSASKKKFLIMNYQKLHIYTVTELTREIKGLLEENFPELWVEGEVSNLRTPSSGHIYFDLKDKESLIHIAFFKPLAVYIPFKLTDGLQVLLYGNIGLYERRGEYQIIAKRIEPKGLGALQLAFEQLKKRLEAEGLFAQEHKRPIPFLIQHLAIVTSPTGAAIRDILKVIDRRNPQMEILINPVLVQGKEAAAQIAEAIEELNKMGGFDAIILTRGGGSLEDLWSFNEEIVARSIYFSEIPIISAVGHEIDWTIADFTADLRAPTPSAAAELCSIQREEILERIENLSRQLFSHIKNRVNFLKDYLKTLSERYGLQQPKELIRQFSQRIDELLFRIENAAQHQFSRIKEKLRNLSSQLNNLSPLAILERGYSVTHSCPEKMIIKDVKKVKKGDLVMTKLWKGSLLSKVIETTDKNKEMHPRINTNEH